MWKSVDTSCFMSTFLTKTLIVSVFVLQIVNLIEETGHFNVTNTTFDFDLFSLDESTVRKLQSYLEATATWQEAAGAGVLMSAAEVASPSCLLFAEETSRNVCRGLFTSLTEASNNHTTKQKHTNSRKHTTPPSRDAGEETGGGGGGVWGNARASDLRLVRVFTTHTSNLCRAEEFAQQTPTPFLPPALKPLPPLQT